MATWTGAKLKNKRTDNVQAYGRFSLCFLTLRLDVAERVSRGGGGVFIIIIFFFLLWWSVKNGRASYKFAVKLAWVFILFVFFLLLPTRTPCSWSFSYAQLIFHSRAVFDRFEERGKMYVYVIRKRIKLRRRPPGAVILLYYNIVTLYAIRYYYWGDKHNATSSYWHLAAPFFSPEPHNSGRIIVRTSISLFGGSRLLQMSDGSTGKKKKKESENTITTRRLLKTDNIFVDGGQKENLTRTIRAYPRITRRGQAGR